MNPSAVSLPPAVALSSLPKGEYVRFSSRDSGPVWVRGDYDRSSRKYSLSRADDMNRECFRKGSFHVFAGFDY